MIGQISSVLSIFITPSGKRRSTAFKYILYSGLIAMIVMSVLVYSVWKFSPIVGGIVSTWIPWEWAQSPMVYTVLFGLIVLILAWLVLKYIMLILMSPLLSYISERREKDLDQDADVKGFSFAYSMARTVRVNSRNLLKEFFITIILFVAGWIPGLNIVAIALLLIIQAYFAGFGIMDYYLERHYSYKESVGLVYQHKWAAIVIGMVFIFLMLIPIIGVLIAPYLCTVTATEYFVNDRRKTLDNHHSL